MKVKGLKLMFFGFAVIVGSGFFSLLLADECTGALGILIGGIFLLIGLFID